MHGRHHRAPRMGHDAQPRHEERETPPLARRACAEPLRHLGWHDAFHHRAVDAALLERRRRRPGPGRRRRRRRAAPSDPPGTRRPPSSSVKNRVASSCSAATSLATSPRSKSPLTGAATPAPRPRTPLRAPPARRGGCRGRGWRCAPHPPKASSIAWVRARISDGGGVQPGGIEVALQRHRRGREPAPRLGRVGLPVHTDHVGARRGRRSPPAPIRRRARTRSPARRHAGPLAPPPPGTGARTRESRAARARPPRSRTAAPPGRRPRPAPRGSGRRSRPAGRAAHARSAGCSTRKRFARVKVLVPAPSTM